MKTFNPQKFRRLIAKEGVPVILSLVLAVMLWINVGGEKTVDTNVMIPVEVINLPRELVISNQFKKEIQVSVNGPRSVILDIQNQRITRQIDLSQATPGTTVVTNDVSSIAFPRGIDVLRIQPSSIILSLDKLVSKQFTVNPVTTGTPMVGYIMKGLKMDPEVITITGPETVLSGFEVLRTQVININGLRKSVQQQVPLDLEPSIVDLIGETTITADINVGLDVVQKEYTLPLTLPLNSVEGSKKTVKVIASVPQYLLDQKIRIDKYLSVFVVEDEENNVGLIKVIPGKELELPVEIVQIDPEIIRLKVIEEETPEQENELKKKSAPQQPASDVQTEEQTPTNPSE